MDAAACALVEAAIIESMDVEEGTRVEATLPRTGYALLEKPGDVFEVPCAHCGRPMEFFKDDLKRRCPACGQFNLNPRNDLACAAWCKTAPECLEELERTKKADHES